MEKAADADRRLRAKCEKTLDLGDMCHGMWAVRTPHTIRFGTVYGDGLKRVLAMESVRPDPREHMDAFYCLYSDYYEVTDPAYWTYVLCEPLLDNGCRRPWQTHLSRLVPVRLEAVMEHTPGPIIEESFDDSDDDDDELSMWYAWDASFDAGEDEEDAWARYQRGLWQHCESWVAYVAWRHDADSSHE